MRLCRYRRQFAVLVARLLRLVERLAPPSMLHQAFRGRVQQPMPVLGAGYQARRQPPEWSRRWRVIVPLHVFEENGGVFSNTADDDGSFFSPLLWTAEISLPAFAALVRESI